MITRYFSSIPYHKFYAELTPVNVEVAPPPLQALPSCMATGLSSTTGRAITSSPAMDSFSTTRAHAEVGGGEEREEGEGERGEGGEMGW